MKMKTGINIILASCAFILSTYTICKLLYFISQTFSPTEIASHSRTYNERGEMAEWTVQDTLWAMFIDATMLTMFILQHSLMANTHVKERIHKIGLNVAERSIYIICTSLTLMLLIYSWHRITWITIWHVDHDRIFVRWLFTMIHIIAWFLTLADMFLSDIFEFIGVKQVYFEFIGHQNPLALKSAELCRLYSHARHSSFICFCILFWVQPIMSLDKFLVAICWTIYMASEWRVDSQDLTYAENQYRVTKTAFLVRHTEKKN